MSIKTVKLEILRPGPPHNQLLSPLTDYIALCGDEPPELFRVPFEHYRLLRRIQDIRSRRAPAIVEASFFELRDEIIRMLTSIRSLTAALAEAHGDGAELVELELVLSASELSLIPFEVAFTPGSPTREIAHREVVITRRSRRVPRARLIWPHRPRILVISASPPGYQPVPLESHVVALRAALAPWLIYIEGETNQARVLEEMQKFLVLVPNASERSIQDATRAAQAEGHPFTHIHLLVHGGEVGQEDVEGLDLFREPRFGLVLHDSHDPSRRDILTGHRFFSAIAGAGQLGVRCLPQVVTLASCDASNQGGVVIPAASVAHDVHDGGIPLVVAAQFPLSYRGSVVFARQLYDQLLSGEDPRRALRETRRAVHSSQVRESGASDWAALVQYGSLPNDIGARIEAAKILATRQHLDAAVSSVNPYIWPRSAGDMLRAWTAIDANRRVLDAFAASDPGLARYIAGFQLRWALIVRDVAKGIEARVESPAHIAEFLELQGASDGMAVVRRHLQSAQRGMLRAYHETQRPEELISYLLATHHLGDPLPAHHALVATLQCIEELRRIELLLSRRFEIERSLLVLWVILPSLLPSDWVECSRLEELLARQLSDDGAPDWYRSTIQRQLTKVAANDFDLYATRRHVGRILARNADLRATVAADILDTIAARAREVDGILAAAGVPTHFSAIVDWEILPDGTQLTRAT